MGTERETLSTTDSNPLKCNDDLNLSDMSSTGVVCGQEGLLPVSFRGGAFTEFFALLRIFEFCVVGGGFGPHMQEKHLFNCSLPMKEF